MKQPIVSYTLKNGVEYKQYREYLPLWIFLATAPIILFFIF